MTHLYTDHDPTGPRSGVSCVDCRTAPYGPRTAPEALPYTWPYFLSVPAPSGPVDSDAAPVAVLVQGDDIAGTDCDHCRVPARLWPRDAGYHIAGRPGVMFRAALYCSQCFPYAYEVNTGERVGSYWGNMPGRPPAPWAGPSPSPEWAACSDCRDAYPEAYPNGMMPGPGKFAGEHISTYHGYHIAGEGLADETDGAAWLVGTLIGEEDDQGFVYGQVFDTEEDASRQWAAILAATEGATEYE